MWKLALRARKQTLLKQARNLHGNTKAQAATSNLGLTSIVTPHRLEQSRHLLRALLRECSYLPDTHARAWVHQHILQRFRNYVWKTWKRREDQSFEERLNMATRRARQGLYQIQRANAGERDRMLKVLLLAYGRTGRRRRELMRPLLPMEQQMDVREAQQETAEQDGIVHTDHKLPKDHDQAAHSIVSTFNKLNTKASTPEADDMRQSQLPELTPQLRALAESQIRASPPDLTRRNPRHLRPQIPALNSWLRHMPQVRVTNMTKAWYATLLSRVLPPLPDEDWHRLRDLATGKLKPDTAKQRRGHPNLADVEEATKGRSALERVVMRGKIDDKVFDNQDVHNITPRFMRRLYAEVFSQCPRLEWNAGGQKWTVEWGVYALYSTQALSGDENTQTMSIKSSMMLADVG